MNIKELMIKKSRYYKYYKEKAVAEIKEEFDNFEMESELIHYLNHLEISIINKYTRTEVDLTSKLLDIAKVNYIREYIEEYIDIEKEKYHYKLKDMEYYINAC